MNWLLTCCRNNARDSKNVERSKPEVPILDRKPMRPQKTTKGNNGETVYCLDSDNEGGDALVHGGGSDIEAVPQPERETVIVDLSKL
jgi:hypothetical protein